MCKLCFVFSSIPPSLSWLLVRTLNFSSVTTPCVIAEAQALGPQLAGAIFIAKTFKLHRCSHKDVAVPAANCIKSMIGKYDF